ncbi:hypothetical protein GIB67_035229, partial [Kingdonia uniflora]
DDAWTILSNARQLLPNIDSSHIKSGNINISHLRMYLTVADDQKDDITIARTFILFMMGHLWFQKANDTVPLGYLTAVDDLDSATQYDWGSVILTSLYHGLDTAFYEYCGVGHPIVKEEVKFSAYPRLRAWERENKGKINVQASNLFILGRYHIDHYTIKMITWETWLEPEMLEAVGRIPLDPPLSMSPHISPAALQEMRQAGFLDLLVHSLSQDFSLPGEAEGPDPGWHIEWTRQRDMLPIARLRDSPPMSSSCGAEELWHLTHRPRAEEGVWRTSGTAITCRWREGKAAWIWSANQGRWY